MRQKRMWRPSGDHCGLSSRYRSSLVTAAALAFPVACIFQIRRFASARLIASPPPQPLGTAGAAEYAIHLPAGDQAGLTAAVRSSVRYRMSPLGHSTLAIRLRSQTSLPKPAVTATAPLSGAIDRNSPFTRLETPKGCAARARPRVGTQNSSNPSARIDAEKLVSSQYSNSPLVDIQQHGIIALPGSVITIRGGPAGFLALTQQRRPLRTPPICASSAYAISTPSGLNMAGSFPPGIDHWGLSQPLAAVKTLKPVDCSISRSSRSGHHLAPLPSNRAAAPPSDGTA